MGYQPTRETPGPKPPFPPKAPTSKLRSLLRCEYCDMSFDGDEHERHVEPWEHASRACHETEASMDVEMTQKTFEEEEDAWLLYVEGEVGQRLTDSQTAMFLRIYVHVMARAYAVTDAVLGDEASYESVESYRRLRELLGSRKTKGDLEGR